MATRLRFSESVAAAVSPAFQSYTHTNSVGKKLSRSDSSTLTTTAYAPDSADHIAAGDAVITQFVSDPMAAGNVFTSGDTLKYAVQCLEANAGNNLTLQIFVSVVNNAGSSVQATIRSKNTGGTEMATTITNRFRSTTLSASYTTAAGDRLVVELSGTGTPVATTQVQGHNWSIRRGNSGAGGDLGENETDTGATLNPWIEFATTITWNDQTATPGVLSLSLSTFAPTVTATNNKTATPGKLSLTLATFAPIVHLNKIATPSTLALTTATFASTVSTPRLATPGILALSLSTFAPTVTVGSSTVAIPGKLSLTLTTSAPTVSAPRLVTPTTVNLTIAAFAPVVSAPRLATPSTRNLSLATFIPVVTASSPGIYVPATANLILSLFVPTIVNPKSASPATASLNLSTFAPVIISPRLVSPATTSLSLAAFAPTVTSAGDKLVTPLTESLVLNRFAPVVTVSGGAVLVPGIVATVPAERINLAEVGVQSQIVFEA
jgi:hypothetical protein